MKPIINEQINPFITAVLKLIRPDANIHNLKDGYRMLLVNSELCQILDSFSENEIEQMAHGLFECIVFYPTYESACCNLKDTDFYIFNRIVFERVHAYLGPQILSPDLAKQICPHVLFQDYSLSKISNLEEVRCHLEMNFAVVLLSYLFLRDSEEEFPISLVFDFMEGIKKLYKLTMVEGESKERALCTVMLALSSLDDTHFYQVGKSRNFYKTFMKD